MKAYFDKIYKGTYKEFVQKLSESLDKEKKEFIVTANPETFMIGDGNLAFDSILRAEHTTIVPDGIGVVKAANMLGIPLKDRITGVELCQDLFRLLNDKSRKLYLFGAKKEVGKALLKKIKATYPNIEILGYTDGYVQEKERAMEEIVKKEPDVILVALGIPHQELLIDKYYERASKGIFLGVGGSFDVLSGMKKRAPRIFIKCNMEWLYRIVSEPKRIGRFYKSNVRFIKKVRSLQRGAGHED